MPPPPTSRPRSGSPPTAVRRSMRPKTAQVPGDAMSITTYAELQAAVGNWLDHGLFAARVPEFITLFEAAANRRLRVREQEATATLTPSSGAVALPADYLAW